MHDKRFVIGSINQGGVEMNSVYSAYQKNTLFFTDVCYGEDYLDEPAISQESRGILKSIGSLLLRVENIINLGEENRIAELSMNNESMARFSKAMQYLFRNNDTEYHQQNPFLMTLTPMSAIYPGHNLGISYFSVLEPMNEGLYKLKHDYQLERTQGPRFEKLKD